MVYNSIVIKRNEVNKMTNKEQTIKKAKEFFECDFHYTEIAYQRNFADNNSYWYGIQRCYGVAQYLDIPEVTELFEQIKKKYEELPKKYLVSESKV